MLLLHLNCISATAEIMALSAINHSGRSTRQSCCSPHMMGGGGNGFAHFCLQIWVIRSMDSRVGDKNGGWWGLPWMQDKKVGDWQVDPAGGLLMRYWRCWWCLLWLLLLWIQVGGVRGCVLAVVGIKDCFQWCSNHLPLLLWRGRW